MSLAYVVVRWEDTDSSSMRFNEKVFMDENDAKHYTKKQDPNGDGFEYTCPCGCGDVHWRSWEVEAVPIGNYSLWDSVIR